MKSAILLMEDIDIEDLESPEALLTAAMIIAIIHVSAILGPTIAIMCIVVKCRRHCCLRALFFITLCIEFALSVTCMIIAFVAVERYDDRASTLKDLDEAVQGCMDEYSDIPDDVVTD